MVVTNHWLIPETFSLIVTSRLIGEKLLVNVKKQIETQEYRLSSWLFRGTVNSSVMVGAVNPIGIGFLTLREEDEFQSSSNALDTHNPNTQGGLKPCMCM